MNKNKNEIAVMPGMPFSPMQKGEDDGPSLSVKQAASAIFRSKWVLFCTTIGGLLAGTWMALGKPNSYISQGTFLIRPGGEQIAINPLAAGEEGGAKEQPLRANAKAILQSEEVIRRTIRRVGADEILAPYSPALKPNETGLSAVIRGSIYALQRSMHGKRGPKEAYREDDALLVMANSLQVDAPKNGQILTAQLLANDPARAQYVLKVFMEEAQRRHLEVYSAERSIQEVETSWKEADEEHNRANAAVQAFLEKHKLEDYINDLAQAQQRARNARKVLDETRLRIATNKMTLVGLRDRLKGLTPMITVKAVVPIANPRIPALRERIGEIEGRLLELRGRLQPGDRMITALEKQVKTAKGELDVELAKKIETRSETREEPNPEYLATKQNISQLQLALVVDEEQFPGLEKSAMDLKAAAAKLLKLQPEHTKLLRDSTQSAARLVRLDDMLAIARKKSDLDRRRISSLVVLDAPNMPLVKEGPKRARIVLGGLLVGFFLGIAFIVIRTLTDSTVRIGEDLEGIDTVKVLATIPNLDNANVKRHERERVTSWT